MAHIITLQRTIVAFPNLFDPHAPAGANNPYYGGCFLFAPDSENDVLVRKSIAQVAKTAFGDRWQAMLEKINENPTKVCYQKRPKTNKEGIPYAGFDGNYHLRASRPLKDGPPMLVDRERQQITRERGLIYPGAIVNARVDIWIPKQGNSVNATLLGVQWVESGEPLTMQRRASAEDFPDLSDTGAADKTDDFEDIEF